MKKRIFAVIVGILVLLTAIKLPTTLASAAQRATASNERAYLVADFDSGKIVMSKNEDERLPIASMVKITTLSLVFDAVKDGRLSLNDNVTVSEYAFSMGGSQAFLDNGASYKAEELIKSVIVASANDSCVALAEHLEGSVEGFVSKMNQKAKELGMENTNYVNCTGLPAENGYSSAKDVAIITRYLMNHQEFFDYAKIWMYDIAHPSGRTTTLTNTNKLVRFFNGMDGGKTGYTDSALSCLSARATRGDTSLVCVVIGAPSSKERNARLSALLNEGFANYESKRIVKKSDNYPEKIYVDGGKEREISAEYGDDIKIFSKKGAATDIKKSVQIYKIKAPVRKGDVVGVETYTDNEGNEYKVEIVSKIDVNKKNFGDFIKDFTSKW